VNEDSKDTMGGERATQFVELLTAHQRKLYAYICTLMFGDSAAIDVLQDTNLDLWARVGDFDFERPFLPWAFGFARNRVSAFRRTQARSRLVFSDEVLDAIDQDCANIASTADVRLVALQKCLEKLNCKQTQLVRDRYLAKTTVKEMAMQLGTTAANVASQLFRARKALAKCIEATLAREER
jgi:RNA polymerase sigma-70 factor (ECF subfamily)